MEKFERRTTQQLTERLQESVRRIIVVAGPRQVGKTTAVRQVLGKRHKASYRFLAVDGPEEDAYPGSDFSIGAGTVRSFATNTTRDSAWLIEKWHAARREAQTWHLQIQTTPVQPTDVRMPFVLVFDEIQLIANWSSVVKGLWDQDRAQEFPMHVVVLGSAPLLVQTGLSESLMGRFELLRMTHWSYSEMRDCFSFTLDQYVYFGGYPGPAPWVLQGNEDRWRDEVIHGLIEPNLVKDVLALARM